MIGKSGRNGLFRSRFSILGQAPSPSRKPTHSKQAFLNMKGIHSFERNAIVTFLLCFGKAVLCAGLFGKISGASFVRS
ncbi:MAG: hypothetical protein V3V31_03635 [Methylococcales bacterium]